MKIYLIRHGQTTGDIEDRYGGDYDDHLTDLGKQQAKELAEKLVGKGIEKVFTSPRIRAQETAEILKTKFGTEVETIENIRERNHYGVLTGLTKSEAKEKYPKEVERVKSYLTAATGGEEYEPFKARVSKTFKEIASKSFSVVAVISHGGPIRMFFREILKYGDIDIEDCAFALIETNNDSFKLLSAQGITKKSS
jgi:broad specificity phosphatase PhoE